MSDLYDEVQRRVAERRRGASQPKTPGPLAKAAGQINAAVLGASDVIPFGAADRLASIAYAAARPSDWGRRYNASMAAEAVHDAEDISQYPIARNVGQLALTTALLARGGRLGGVFAAPRLAGAARITSREALSMLGAGGAAGLGAQAVGDTASGKISSPGDYAGAGIGGVAGVLALPKGPERAAAFDGAVTSIAQDLLNGRPVSLEQAGRSAMAARTAGVLANKAAMTWAENLPSAAKGKLGETLGALRGIVDWRPRVALGTTPVKIPGTSKNWKPDAMRGTRINAPDTRLYEDKFGRKADLRTNQRLARAKLGDNFQLNHFLPRDVGKVGSSLAAMFGIQSSEHISPQRGR